MAVSSKEKARLSLKEFLETFTGVGVAVEKNESESVVKPPKITLQKTLYTLSVIGALGLIISYSPDIMEAAFFMFSIVGMLLSYIIVQPEQGVETSLGNAFCSGVSEKRDCDAIVQPNGAVLFGRFKLSTSSIIYFIEELEEDYYQNATASIPIV